MRTTCSRLLLLLLCLAHACVLPGCRRADSGVDLLADLETADLNGPKRSITATRLDDLSSRHLVRMGFMKKRLTEWSRDQNELGGTLKRPATAAPDRETEELLRALGYVQ